MRARSFHTRVRLRFDPRARDGDLLLRVYCYISGNKFTSGSILFFFYTGCVIERVLECGARGGYHDTHIERERERERETSPSPRHLPRRASVGLLQPSTAIPFGLCRQPAQEQIRQVRLYEANGAIYIYIHIYSHIIYIYMKHLWSHTV